MKNCLSVEEIVLPDEFFWQFGGETLLLLEISFLIFYMATTRTILNPKALAAGLLAAALGLASCIREEALNAEADIVGCTLAGEVLNREAVIGNDRVTLYLKKGTDLTSLSPEFTLTPGATISPDSGTERDFTSPQEYEVTSEDGRWKKRYRVEATTRGMTATAYRFEHARTDAGGKYHVFYETDDKGGETLTWASGNPGFALTGAGATPADYPTYQSGIGYKGRCLALTTRRTGSFGAMMDMPIAAGNLFLGTFDVLNALKDPLTATRFGMPFDHVPILLRGYYKYRSGEMFYELDAAAKDKLKPVAGRKDRFDIYAVFYESTGDMKTLDGTNALSEENPNILAVARIAQDEAVETDEWTPFEIAFEFREGKRVDAEKLAAERYSLAVVFTSSLHGDRFEGAPGSTLCVDEVTLEYREEEPWE